MDRRLGRVRAFSMCVYWQRSELTVRVLTYVFLRRTRHLVFSTQHEPNMLYVYGLGVILGYFNTATLTNMYVN